MIKLILLLFIITQILFVFSSYITDDDLLNSVFVRNEINKFFHYPNKIMWKVVDNVNPNYPFIFFHQRKAGGTSIRHGLMMDANYTQLSHYIICYSTTNCDDYHLPKKKFAIYAGHFQWNSLMELNRLHVNKVLNFSCTTNFREPISRIKSCLYFRFLDEISNFEINLTYNNKSCLQFFPIDELENLLVKRDKYGNSCLDEPFRILS